MIHFDDIKTFVHTESDKKTEGILSIITTLISGLIIIVTINPEYLRELNPFTLFLLSVSCALPVWAFNQLLWWYLGRKISGEIVAKVAFVFDITGPEKKVLSFVLSRLMNAVDIMRFIPAKNIANLVTILAIYGGAVVLYFASGTLSLLYGTIFAISLFIWLAGMLVLKRTSRKVDVAYLKMTWDNLKFNEELLMHINQQFERIERLVKPETKVQPERDVSEKGSEI